MFRAKTEPDSLIKKCLIHCEKPGEQSEIWGPGPSLAIIALIIIISGNDTSYVLPRPLTGHCWSNGGMGQNHLFTLRSKQNTSHHQEHFSVLLTTSSKGIYNYTKLLQL